MARVLVPVADGSEEMETVIVVDVLRRAGWDVVLAGLEDGPVTASRGVRIVPDTTMDMVLLEAFDVLVVPGGGEGVENLRADERVKELIVKMSDEGKIVAAVCAGPLVLQDAGVLEGKRVTSHPAVAEKLTLADRVDEAVVVDGNIITSQGPGTCFKFALEIIGQVDGREKANGIANGMVVEIG